MSVKDLLQGIEEENADAITTHFEEIVKQKVSTKLKEMKKEVAQKMFKESIEESTLEEETLEVKAQGNKFKVTKVMGDFGDTLKVGEMLSSQELDDLSEMGIVINKK